MLGQRNLFLATFSCFGSSLSCAGPGVGIISTVPDRSGVSGAYMEMDGTSMASPAACGALAAILAQDTHYAGLPRDSSRSSAARNLLAQHCEPFDQIRGPGAADPLAMDPCRASLCGRQSTRHRGRRPPRGSERVRCGVIRAGRDGGERRQPPHGHNRCCGERR